MWYHNGGQQKIVKNKKFTALENFVWYGVPPIQLMYYKEYNYTDTTL